MKEITKLIKFCGFDIEDDCFHFYKNKRAVRTPSSEQVRQPIFKSGLDYWKNYESNLDELANNLKY